MDYFEVSAKDRTGTGVNEMFQYVMEITYQVKYAVEEEKKSMPIISSMEHETKESRFKRLTKFIKEKFTNRN